MAQGYKCDSGCTEEVFVVMSQPATGDTHALCANCMMEWAYALLAGSEPGTELIKMRMGEIMQEIAAEGAKPKRGGRKPAAAQAETGEATDAGASATDTPDTV